MFLTGVSEKTLREEVPISKLIRPRILYRKRHLELSSHKALNPFPAIGEDSRTSIKG